MGFNNHHSNTKNNQNGNEHGCYHHRGTWLIWTYFFSSDYNQPPSIKLELAAFGLDFVICVTHVDCAIDHLIPTTLATLHATKSPSSLC